VDDADADGVHSTGDITMVFKTTDGGSSWERVFSRVAIATGAPFDVMLIIEASPDYANDETVYVAQADTRLWKTTNAGETFVGLTAPGGQNITALGVVDSSTYFVGGADSKLYKSGNWEGTNIYATAESIVISPDYDNDSTLVVGMEDGDVRISTNDGSSFSRLGVDDELGDGNNVIIALPPDFSSEGSSKYIYAGVNSPATGTAGLEGIWRWKYEDSNVWDRIDDQTTAPEIFGMGFGADGTLYSSNNLANGGVLRTVTPTSSTSGGRDYESATSDLFSGATLQSLAVIGGSNVLYAIAGGATVDTTYGYAYRLLTFTDTLSMTPVMTGPTDGRALGDTDEVILSWEKISVPGETVYYRLEVAYDSSMSTTVVDPNTRVLFTNTYVATGLRSGQKYYWRVYVDDGNPLRTRKPSAWTFTTALSQPGESSGFGVLKAPAYGATGVQLRPSFNWISTPGATGYEFQLGSNPDVDPWGYYLTDVLVSHTAGNALPSNVYQLDQDLEYSTTYYWAVRAVSADAESDWARGVFTTMAPAVAPPPPIVVEPTPAPIIEIPPSPITPAIIWAIIGIGAVLVIALIILIIRTRRVP
jgi:hypothetical protein